MLRLDDSLVIGKGAHRVCYRHPSDQNKCIKISSVANDSAQRLECRYYEKLAAANINWKHLSRYYNTVETNLGDGYVYELIKDYDDIISRSLMDYLFDKKNQEVEREVVLDSLAKLKNYLLENKIIVRNLRPYNVVFRRTAPAAGIAVIIDNIGHHNNLFHISDRVAFMARKDIQKKWAKFESILNNKQSRNFVSVSD